MRHRQAAKALLTTSIPRRLLLTRGPGASSSLARVPASHVALTFDDGPHPEHTPRLLDCLAAKRIVASFFVVGRYAERYPSIVRRICAEGHDLGNHTYSHVSSRSASTRTLIEEVRRTWKLLEDITGRPPSRLFRPPRGELTFGALLSLWRERQTVVLWNADPHDGAGPDNSNLVAWCEHYRPRTGDIVLMHDDHRHVTGAVPMLARLAARGVEFSSISRYVGKRSEGLHVVGDVRVP